MVSMNLICKLSDFRPRSLLPLVLAQLLIHFQKPIVTNDSVQNITNSSINDMLSIQLNNATNDRSIRSSFYGAEISNNDINFHYIKKRYAASEQSSNGKIAHLNNVPT